MQTIKIGNFNIKFEINNPNHITIFSNNFIYNIDNSGKFYNYEEKMEEKTMDNCTELNTIHNDITKEEIQNDWTMWKYSNEIDPWKRFDEIEKEQKIFYADTSDEPWKNVENKVELPVQQEPQIKEIKKTPKKPIKRVTVNKKKN